MDATGQEIQESLEELAMRCLSIGVLGALLWAASAAGAVQLQGAGATFPYPLYSKWFSEFQKSAKGVAVNYQSIGSGGGIRQVLAGTVDFGASDAPMTDEELARATTPILHIFFRMYLHFSFGLSTTMSTVAWSDLFPNQS
jgi:ABC-type phosphate transport system substrate-binding protein